MYNVSELYKQKILEPKKICKIEGTLKTNIGVIINITDENTSSGSVSIDTKCVSGEELSLGSVYTAELNVAINSEVDRYSLYGGIIKLSWFIKINETDFEEVPLGEYEINVAERSGRFINIKAYDYMTNLDVTLGNTLTGTPYELLNFTSLSTGVELAQTESEINAMAPAGFIFNFDSLNVFSTHRDLVSNIAVALGGFAVINRFGKLEIRRFGKTVVRTVDDEVWGRKSGKFSDYTNKYSRAISTVNGKLYVSGGESFMTMTLPNINICVGKSDAEIQSVIDNILLQLPIDENITPFSASYISDPSFDLGDLIENVGRDVPNTGLKSLITNLRFGHKKKTDIKCVGKNPRLADTKTATQKAIDQSVDKAVSQAATTVITYTNAATYSLGNDFTTVITIKFISVKESTPLFNGQILLDVTQAGLFEINYNLNGNIMLFKPMQNYFEPGKYIMTLSLPVTGIGASSGNTLKVQIKSEEGIATIDTGNIVASLLASGMYDDTIAWDGTLEFEEVLGYVNISKMSIKPFTADMVLSTYTDTSSPISEVLGYVPLVGFNILGVTGSLIIE